MTGSADRKRAREPQDDWVRHVEESLARLKELLARAGAARMSTAWVESVDDALRRMHERLFQSVKMPAEATLLLAQRSLERGFDLSRRAMERARVEVPDSAHLEDRRSVLSKELKKEHRVRIDGAATPVAWAGHAEVELQDEQFAALSEVARRQRAERGGSGAASSLRRATGANSAAKRTPAPRKSNAAGARRATPASSRSSPKRVKPKQPAS